MKLSLDKSHDTRSFLSFRLHMSSEAFSIVGWPVRARRSASTHAPRLQ